ncbi:MAG: sulfur carrier protein ThiS [Clostridium sp.]|uniref:sulfur carrier protein ThiS n=1 Tax=Clostridium sp. DSM 8431 TaxID=1761781 RepID=UPI0008E4194A|nr:sulfur carrier protein ThiS [Clostridium sp. DSM 8431]MCR4943081.1 sulfur carrier protein ThiS [Clostridium sp.]SFU63152.1 sulfur carrier protein ThiS [Clostridium sp. DSM 8431]
MVKVNGEIVENAVDLSLEDYLKQENYTISRVAVELNGNIVPKADYAKTMIAKGDKLEVVSFVGGG